MNNATRNLIIQLAERSNLKIFFVIWSEKSEKLIHYKVDTTMFIQAAMNGDLDISSYEVEEDGAIILRVATI